MSELTLMWKDNGQSHEKVVTAERACIIGRSSDCDITVSEPTVSRKHALLFFKDSTGYVRNLSKTNPILIHGPTGDITLGHNDEAELNTIAVLHLGQLTVDISIGEGAHSIKEGKKVDLKIRCSNCSRLVDDHWQDCPWCGAALAGGDSVFITVE